MKNRYSWLRQPALYGMLGISALLCTFPFYWMYVVASRDNSAVSQIPPAMLPGSNFGNTFSRITQVFNLVAVYRNTLLVAGVIALSQVFTSTLAGFAFAKLRFRGRDPLFVTVLVFLMIPIQLGIIPMYLLMAKLGWIDTLQAIILPSMVSAFGVYWMRQAMSSSVPQEMIEAGAIDGASYFRIYRSIAFPLVKASALVLGLFGFLTAWNDFAWPLIVLNSPDKYTAQVAVSQLNGSQIQDYPGILGGSLVTALPLIVLFLFTARQFVAGVMEGAVKG